MGTVHAKAIDQPPLPQATINYYECEATKDLPLDAKARVDRIHIDGLGRTYNDFAEDAVKDVFNATTFQEVLLKAHKAREKLASMTCFRNISVHIDVSKGPKATDDGLEVTFFVKEFKRVIGGVNTQVGNNEGSLIIGLKAPNLLGRGERVQAEYSYGSKKSNNFSVSLIKPFMGEKNPVFTTTFYQNLAEFPTSGFRQLEKGVIFDFAFNSIAALKHNVQYDATIRHQAALSRNSSFDVREASGVTLKSALRHILSYDGRDEAIFPTCGALCQLTTELAGLGGDVGFVKNDVYLQGNLQVVEDVVLQGVLSGGWLGEISSNMKVGMSDKYYLGGPLSVRGFQSRGIGDKGENGDDALGATCHMSGGLHLFTPLPFRPGRGGLGEYFRTHFFLNAGNVASNGTNDRIVDQLKNNIRLTTGFGIAIRLGQMARVEVNYCFPLKFIKGDRLNPGVQFGVGVQFT